MAIWLHRSGRHCEHETKFLDESRVYLTWGELHRNLSKVSSRDELLAVLEEVYPKASLGKRRQNSGQIWAFSKRMSQGDWVCMPSKRKTIHIGEITSGYTYDPNVEDPYQHYRTVNWLETDIPRTNFDQDLLHSLGAFSTICQIKRNDAEARIRAMKTNDWKSIGVHAQLTIESNDDEIATDEETTVQFDLEQIARDQIARTIYAQYKGYGLESLVEAILQAQGFTTHHSEKGADGGIDILAAPDTLGFGQPRICVQVKSQDSPLERPVLDQLVGTMQHVGAEQGLLVCWGGFKKTVIAELPRLFFKVRLWDQNDLIDQFLVVYDKLDEDLRAEMPLKRVWAIASVEIDDTE